MWSQWSCEGLWTDETPASWEQLVLSLTIDDSGHPPETQQDQEAEAVEGVLVEDEDNIQHKRNHHDQTIKHLKFVVEELPAIGEEFPHELHHEKGQKSQAEVVKNLQKGKRGVSGSKGKRAGGMRGRRGSSGAGF